MFVKIFKKILSNIVLVGIICMIFMTGHIFWLEYSRNRQIELSRRLAPDTRWTTRKFPVYFVLGKNLGRINLDGSELKFLYKGMFLIQELSFSPDGRYLAIISEGEILLYDLREDKIDLIHSLGVLVQGKDANGLIRAVKWAPDSKKFCYEVYRWSDVASQNHFYLYDVDAEKKSLVQTPPWSIGGVVWDKNTQELYGFKRNRQGFVDSTPSIWKIYALSIGNVPPDMIRLLHTPSEALTLADFRSAGIEPFFAQNFSNRVGQKNVVLNSRKKDRRLGMDQNRFLFYLDAKGKKRKLFSLRYDELSIKHLRWLPDDRYVVMTHSSLGVLVLDPLTGKIGKLVSAQAFGWYEP